MRIIVELRAASICTPSFMPPTCHILIISRVLYDFVPSQPDIIIQKTETLQQTFFFNVGVRASLCTSTNPTSPEVNNHVSL